MRENRSLAASRGRGLFPPRACRRQHRDTITRLPQNPQSPIPLITEVQDWQRQLGDGVDKRPYGRRRNSNSMSSGATCRG